MALPAWLLIFALYWLLVLPIYRPGSNYVFAFSLVIATALCGYLAIFDMPAFVFMWLLICAAVVCRRWHCRWRTFAASAVGVMVLSVLCAMPRILEVADLLHRYQPESLRERLKPRATSFSRAENETENFRILEQRYLATPSDSDGVLKHLETVESAMHFSRRNSLPRVREFVLPQLASLHEKSLKIFVEMPGFGTSRIGHIRIRKQLVDLPEMEPIPFAGNLSSYELMRLEQNATWSETLPVGESLTNFEKGHAFSIANFANPKGFGYARDWYRYYQFPDQWPRPDISAVVGFQAHGFRATPALAGEHDEIAWLRQLRPVWERAQWPHPDDRKPVPWLVDRLDLVSLWLNDPPAVYITENLPRMDELGSAPTRPLSEFETRGLERLVHGETLVVSSTTNIIRVLGAVRASKTCLNCHDADQGQLLGAFSYVLVRR